MNNYTISLPCALGIARFLLAIWCIVILFFCSIIVKQRAQRKKLCEMKSSLQRGANIIAHNGIAGKIIHITAHTVIVELASGQKKELPFHLIDYVYTE